jgi:hypothetical protein
MRSSAKVIKSKVLCAGSLKKLEACCSSWLADFENIKVIHSSPISFSGSAEKSSQWSVLFIYQATIDVRAHYASLSLFSGEDMAGPAVES